MSETVRDGHFNIGELNGERNVWRWVMSSKSEGIERAKEAVQSILRGFRLIIQSIESGIESAQRGIEQLGEFAARVRNAFRIVGSHVIRAMKIMMRMFDPMGCLCGK